MHACRKVSYFARQFLFCTLIHFSALFGVHIWKNAWFWKVWKVAPWYTKLPMYVCLECWLAPMKFKQAFFSRAFDFFDYFSQHSTNVSTFVLCRKIRRKNLKHSELFYRRNVCVKRLQTLAVHLQTATQR